jgi:hypothetical protein
MLENGTIFAASALGRPNRPAEETTMKSTARHRLSTKETARFRSTTRASHRSTAKQTGRAATIGPLGAQGAVLLTAILAWHFSGWMPVGLDQFGGWSALVAWSLGELSGSSHRAFRDTASPHAVVARDTARVSAGASAIALFLDGTGLF